MSTKTNYERTAGQLTVWPTINDCLTMTIDGSKRTNDIKSLHSQWHHGLTDRRPITSRLYWPIRSTDNQSLIPSTDVIQLSFTLKMTTAQVVETSVSVNNNSPFPDCVHPDDDIQPTYEMTSGFKPYTVLIHVKLTSFQPSVPSMSSIKFYTNTYASLTNQNARFGFILNLFNCKLRKL